MLFHGQNMYQNGTQGGWDGSMRGCRYLLGTPPPGHPRDPRDPKLFPRSFEAIKLLPMVGKPKDSNTLDRQKGSADDAKEWLDLMEEDGAEDSDEDCS